MNEQREDNIRSQLGSRIRLAREKQGISLRNFALMIGISYPYLSKVENGKVSITVDVLEKIANGLDVPISDLFL